MCTGTQVELSTLSISTYECSCILAFLHTSPPPFVIDSRPHSHHTSLSLTNLQGWGSVWVWPLVGSFVTLLCPRLLVGDAVNKLREVSLRCWCCGLCRAGDAENWKDGGVVPPFLTERTAEKPISRAYRWPGRVGIGVLHGSSTSRLGTCDPSWVRGAALIRRDFC